MRLAGLVVPTPSVPAAPEAGDALTPSNRRRRSRGASDSEAYLDRRYFRMIWPDLWLRRCRPNARLSLILPVLVIRTRLSRPLCGLFLGMTATPPPPARVPFMGRNDEA